jgi:actin-like ATPase involved in cell morphogenesis
MVLTGGGALLRELDRLSWRRPALPVIVADDPSPVSSAVRPALEGDGQARTVFTTIKRPP